MSPLHAQLPKGQPPRTKAIFLEQRSQLSTLFHSHSHLNKTQRPRSIPQLLHLLQVRCPRVSTDVPKGEFQTLFRAVQEPHPMPPQPDWRSPSCLPLTPPLLRLTCSRDCPLTTHAREDSDRWDKGDMPCGCECGGCRIKTWSHGDVAEGIFPGHPPSSLPTSRKSGSPGLTGWSQAI